MRRKDREITNFEEIIDILRRAETVHLGMHGDPCPYVVPLSFGFEAEQGRITLYFHGALEGLKHDLLARSPHVCVEACLFHGYHETPASITAKYESLIGFGTCVPIKGEEAAHGVDLLLEHCGYAGYSYDQAALNHTGVYKIALKNVTGKRNL